MSKKMPSDVYVIMAGTPCVNFSRDGKREGAQKGLPSSLYEEVIKVASEHQVRRLQTLYSNVFVVEEASVRIVYSTNACPSPNY